MRILGENHFESKDPLKTGCNNNVLVIGSQSTPKNVILRDTKCFGCTMKAWSLLM